MSPEFRSLLVKEWSERRRLLWFGLGLMLVYLGYCLAYEMEYQTRALVASYYNTCTGFGCFGAVLLAMSTATGEYTQRTLKFSLSLPVSRKSVAWARLMGAWACLAVPILICGVAVTLILSSGLVEQAGLRPANYNTGAAVRFPERPSLSKAEALVFLGSATAIAAFSAIYIVTLISLVGTYCRSEGVVGFFGAIVALLMTIFSGIRSDIDKTDFDFLSNWIGGVLPGSMAISWGYEDLDGANYTDLDLAPLILKPLLMNGLITAGLGAWFARRYGCRAASLSSDASPSSRRWLSRGPNALSWFSLRWPGRISALAWLDARQSVPLCVAGFIVAVLITCISLIETRGEGTVTARMMGELPSNSWFVGLLWGAMIAVAIFSSELQPDLERFWRSRPISPSAWFWTKFGVGLAALLLTLDVIPVLMARAAAYQPEDGRAGVAYIACIPLLHSLVYALAVAAICRLRRPIPAAITALVMFFLLDQILESIPVYPRLSTLNVYNELETAEDANGTVNLMTAGYPLIYGIVAGIILAAIVFARRTVIHRIVGRSVAGMLLLICLLPGRNVHSAEPLSAADIATGIREREAQRHSLHLRFSTRLVRTVAFFADVAGNRPSAVPAVDQENRNRYEYFDRPPCRAWTEFDADGKLKSLVTYDGTVKRNYDAGHARTLYHGNVMAAKEPPAVPFFSPNSMFGEFAGISLPDIVGSAASENVKLREENGEQFADIGVTHTFTVPDATSYEQRYQVTINLTRNYWPVRTVLEVFEGPSRRLISRNLTTAQGWIDAGPIAYPQTIEKHSYLKAEHRPVDSDELVFAVTQICEVEFVNINGDIPDSAFDRPFPPGTLFYDFRDRKWYDVDDAMVAQPHTPRPKGLRGAVLAYHLLWISVASIYLSRRSRPV